ncbi:Putative potassium transporter [Septoria linicola]|uniref:Potassium transporter n=1 Tax=Septoria linicola TaxID=215465 RepID=A0A9Q9AT48_9PEZI|nr:Putative potassium transporter [Septoria linicola]
MSGEPSGRPTTGELNGGEKVHAECSTASLSGDGELNIRDTDIRQRQAFKGWAVFWLAYQATGVIYGDIGTSPLYVYSSTFSAEPSRQDILGVLSFIIWTLTLMVTIKYVLIVLRADDEGEGGTFAIYTLLSRYSDIMKRDPRIYQLVKMERHKTDDLHAHNEKVRNWLEKSQIAHAALKLLAVLGVSLVLADGVLTPAQSVLGAIQGIKVADDSITTPTIVGVTCAILVLLFLVQPLGVHRVSSAFAPIVIIWLLFNGCFGIYNLVKHDYSVLGAFSPYFAGDWLMRNRTKGWKSLGGILLCFTGVECMFADMGAFNRRAVQLSWVCLAYPCLLLAYTGQAAYLTEDPSAYSNPFFNTVPPGLFWPSLVLAILAAIVASQATITACFQLLAQIMNSSYFPQIQMHYTSKKHYGQVYIPMANWLLMIGCVVVTAVYNNTTRLGHAYGVCVILVTFITTNLVALAAIIAWRIHPAIVLVVWLSFIMFDGLYLTSSLVKVPDGAWFTLLLAACLAMFFGLWRYGKETQWICEAKYRTPLSSLVMLPTAEDRQALTQKYGGGELSSIDGVGIFLDKSGAFTPKVYEQWLSKFRTQMDIVVFMHLRALSIPHIPEEDRFEITETHVKNVFRLIVRHGYDDHIVSPDLAGLIYQELRSSMIREKGSSPQSNRAPLDERLTTTNDGTTAARLDHLEAAFTSQTLYMVGKQQMRIDSSYNVVKRVVLEIFLWIRDNSRSKVEKLNVPAEKLVEVGFVGII